MPLIGAHDPFAVAAPALKPLLDEFRAGMPSSTAPGILPSVAARLL